MSTPVQLVHIQALPTTPVEKSNSTSVIKQNDQEKFYDSAIRRLIRKLDRRLLPFVVLLQISSTINLVSIGHAKLMHILTDLHMSNSDWDLAISLFYVAKVISHVPSNLLLRFIGPTRYLSLSMLAWGGITIGMAFVTNAQQLLVVRFLLGVIQAGYFPGVIIYISFWYCKKQQIVRIALLFGSAIVARILTGFLAYGVGKMEGIGGLRNWQWMFLLDSSSIIPLVIITCLFLDNIPNAVQWLNSTEKQLLTNLLRNDIGIADRDSASSNRISWPQIRSAFVDWRIYLYGLIAMGDLAANLSLTTFFPTLIKSMGYVNTEAHLMTIPSYVVAFVCCLLVSYSSSRWNEHGYHLALSLLTGLLGFILMIALAEQGKAAIYVSVTLAFCGVFSAYPLLLSWLTNNVGGHTKRAMAVSHVLGIAQFGAIATPMVYREDDKPTYRRGHLICGATIAASLILTMILRICLMRENRRRMNLSLEEYQREAAINEPCDKHPDVRYVL